MEAVLALAQQSRITAAAVAVLPAVIAGAASVLDQSMRRPSMASLVMHSMHLIS